MSLGDKIWAPLYEKGPEQFVKEWFEEWKSRERSYETYQVRQLEIWCKERADEFLTACGVTVDESSRLKLAKAISAAMQRASLTLARFAQGSSAQKPPA